MAEGFGVVRNKGQGVIHIIHSCRGRDTRCRVPPAQIRTCAANAYGSYLGFVTQRR